MKKTLIILFLIYNSCLYADSSWVHLNDAQQKLLLPFHSEWDDLTQQTRDKLIKNTDKWLKMSPQERRESKQKLSRFKQLPLDQQNKIKQRVNRYNQLSTQEQKQLRYAHKKYQNLKPEQKKELRNKFNQMPPHQRKKVLRNYAKTQRARDFSDNFSKPKRQPIIEMFKSFKPEQRMKLRRHMKGLTPKKRHDTTLDILAMDRQARSSFINSL